MYYIVAYARTGGAEARGRAQLVGLLGLLLYECTYVHTNIYNNIYIYIYIERERDTYTKCMYAYVYIYIYMFVCMCMYIYIYIYREREI